MKVNTTVLLMSLVLAMNVGAADAATTATREWVKTNVGNPLNDNQQALNRNMILLRDMVNVKGTDGNWIPLETEAKLAIPAINELNAKLADKQDKLTAGDGIEIVDGVISSEVDLSDAIGELTDAEGNAISVQEALEQKQDVLENSDVLETITAADVAAIETNTTNITNLTNMVENKQDALTAGANINIDGNVISATDTNTTYTAGDGIAISENNVISSTVDTSSFVTSGDLESYATTETVNALDTRVTTAEGAISTLNGTGDGSVAKQIADAIAGQNFDGFATDAELTAVSDEVTTLKNAGYQTDADVKATVEGYGYATATTVSGIDTRLTAAEGEIDTLQTDVTALKAVDHSIYATTEAMNAAIEAVEYDDTELAGRVTTNETNIKGLQDANYVSSNGMEAGSYLVTKGSDGVIKWTAISVVDAKGDPMAL